MSMDVFNLAPQNLKGIQGVTLHQASAEVVRVENGRSVGSTALNGFGHDNNISRTELTLSDYGRDIHAINHRLESVTSPEVRQRLLNELEFLQEDMASVQDTLANFRGL